MCEPDSQWSHSQAGLLCVNHADTQWSHSQAGLLCVNHADTQWSHSQAGLLCVDQTHSGLIPRLLCCVWTRLTVVSFPGCCAVCGPDSQWSHSQAVVLCVDQTHSGLIPRLLCCVKQRVFLTMLNPTLVYTCGVCPLPCPGYHGGHCSRERGKVSSFPISHTLAV